jgi:predicted dehydrogenase
MIRIAQIGCGYWGPHLLRNLFFNKRCAVKWVVDLSSSRQKFVKETYPDIGVTDQLETVLDDQSIEAVIISTHAQSHFELARHVLRQGKHVLVEKPMAMTVAEVDELDQLASKKNRTAMVGHTLVFHPATRFLKRLIEDGELGDIRYIYNQRLNLGQIRSDIDALWNLAPHDVSVIQYILSHPTPVQIERNGKSFVQKGIDDVVFLNIYYNTGVMANVHVSWLNPQKVRKMTIVGSKKMVVYDDMSEYQLTIFDKGIDPMARIGENMPFDKPDIFKFVHRSGAIEIPKIEYKEPLTEELNHFFDCIEGKTQCETGPAHARSVIQILSQNSSQSL